MRIVSLLLACVISLSAAATSAPIHEYQLDNGLKLFVKEDHRAPVVAIQLWYKVGASYEYDGITGISHVLEHMMSKGTPRYPKGAFSKLIAANGGLKNATTAADFTFYSTKVTPDKIPLVFDLESDRMQNLIFKPEELARELHVVMEERRMRTDDNPFGTLRERLRAAAFLSSPYHHPVVGWPQDIQHLTVTNLRNWYQQWYAPNNANLVVIGDTNPHQVLAWAKKYFGTVKAKATPALKPQREIESLGEKRIIVNFPAKNAAVIIGYTVPSIKTAKHAWEPYALMLLATILEGHSNKLDNDLVKRQQLASQIEIEYVPYSRLLNLFTITATATPGTDINLLEQKLAAEIKELHMSLVSERILRRAKKRLITDRIYYLDTLTSQAREIGRLETIGLSWQLLKDFEKNIQAISAQQLQDIAKSYFTDNNLSVAILQPIYSTAKTAR